MFNSGKWRTLHKLAKVVRYITSSEIADETGLGKRTVDRRLAQLKKDNSKLYHRAVRAEKYGKKTYRSDVILPVIRDWKRIEKNGKAQAQEFINNQEPVDQPPSSVTTPIPSLDSNEETSRVMLVHELLLRNATRQEIIKYFQEKLNIKIGTTLVDSYIRKAKNQIRDNVLIDREYEFAKAKEQYEFLYKMAVQNKDYKTALAVKKEMNEMLRIYTYDPAAFSSGDDLSQLTDEELDAIIAQEDKIKNTG